MATKTVNMQYVPTVRAFCNIQKKEIDSPYVIDQTMANFIADVLEKRVTTETAELELSIATELRQTGSCTLSEESEAHLKSIISSMPIDNLLKGLILDCFKN